MTTSFLIPLRFESNDLRDTLARISTWLLQMVSVHGTTVTLHLSTVSGTACAYPIVPVQKRRSERGEIAQKSPAEAIGLAARNPLFQTATWIRESRGS